ncbi:hypothetical protein EON65_43560 [archaeon]|nr:MAG: hypothetical protein EON65_43560 [archaeon]
MVANSIAITTFHPSLPSISTSSPIRSIKSHKYYWKTAVDGNPTAIFTVGATEQSVCESSDIQPALWPTAGISIRLNDTQSRLVIICQVSCGGTGVKALNFFADSTLIVTVTNLHDSPDDWEYTTKLLGHKTEYVYRWMSVVQAHGLRSAHVDDTLYFLGSYQPQRSSSTVNGYQIVGRISARDLLAYRLEKLEIATSANAWRPWTEPSLVPMQLFSPLLTEASMWREGGEWMVLSLHMMEHYLQLCKAADITAQWNCSYIAEIEETWQHPRLITYAGKMHPELLSPVHHINTNSSLRLLVSVVSNTLLGPDHLFEPENKEVYTPKFMYLQQRIQGSSNSSVIVKGS